MKVTDFLKKDHDTVKKMFAAFEKMGAKVKEKRSSQGEEICEELRIHATVEEEIFYPAVKNLYGIKRQSSMSRRFCGSTSRSRPRWTTSEKLRVRSLPSELK